MGGRGYVRDPYHVRSVQPLYRAAVGSIPDAWSLEKYEWPILNQGDTGSCTGHGTAQAICVALKNPGWIASPRLLYTMARVDGRSASTRVGGPYTRLSDDGTNPALVVDAAARWGVAAMQGTGPTDCFPINVNDEPVLMDFVRTARRLVIGPFRIDGEWTDQGVEAACHSIYNGNPVCLGVFVDTIFENQTGPVSTVNKNDPTGGGHWICATSYRTSASGERIFRGPNSWGPTWGDTGHWEGTASWLKLACSDLYSFSLVPASAQR